MAQTINTFKTLDAIFGTTPTIDVEHSVVPYEEPTTNLPVVSNDVESDFPASSELMDDYQKARDSMRHLLDKGGDALENMIQIAQQTESARGFEVVSNLIKTMSEVSKDLIALHEATNKAKKKNDTGGASNAPQIVKNTQNNVVFQGSTTDLFDMLGKDQ